MISLQNVSYTYPHSDKQVLVNINLNIAAGEFLAVVGRNGSGKSTLARLINGMLLPKEGLVLVDGMKTTDQENLFKIRQKVGLLLASPDNQIIFNLVEEDLAFGPGNLGLPADKIRDRVDTALEMVSMEEFKKHPPYLLSGGQKQKVALAGLLAMEPQCLVLDEPTIMLDTSSKQKIIENIVKINQTNVTIIMITHDLQEAIYADRIAILDQGKIRDIIRPVDLGKYTEVLRQVGVEQIEVIEFADKLKKQAGGQLKLPENILTIDDLVAGLCQLK